MLILSTGCLYRHGLNRIFEFAKTVNFSGIELVMNEVYDTQDIAYIRSLIEEYAIPVPVIVPFHAKSPVEIKEAVNMAVAIGAKHVVLRSPLYSQTKFTKWFKNELPKMMDAMGGVKVSVENVPAGKNLLIPQYSMGNINEMKRFKYLCLDTSALVTRKIDLMMIYEKMKSRLQVIHISNWYKHKEHTPPFEGLLPLESFLTKLQRDKFPNPLVLKVDARFMSHKDAKEVIARLKKCKDYVDQYFH